MSDRLRTAAAAIAAVLSATAAQAETYALKVTPSTVAWGNYDAAAKPVLTIKSGDTVVVDTVLTNSPTGLERNGVPLDSALLLQKGQYGLAGAYVIGSVVLSIAALFAGLWIVRAIYA